MKQIFVIVVLISIFARLQAQQTISGTVTDGHEPLAGANVFLRGTMDGCLTDSLGRFSFTTAQRDSFPVTVTYLGCEDFNHVYTATKDIHIRMRSTSATIGEVVVTGSSFSFGNGNAKSLKALDIVAEGSSCGDIVAALQTLPGSQKVGEDGKLYVRGGSSEETQTFINGMHVLEPYTAGAQNTASRGRFSPFLFKGIQYSLGGYGGEYGQALSAVLPMETTDRCNYDKFGLSASLLDWNAGGTKVWKNSSLSFNTTYMDLWPYTKLFPGRYQWTRPYQDLSGEIQYKADLGANATWKTYMGYDRSHVGNIDDARHFNLWQDNVYLNSTIKCNFSHGWLGFGGMATSFVWDNINEALSADDRFKRFRSEVHLKAKLQKIFSSWWMASMGVEDYIRNYKLNYTDTVSSKFNQQYNMPAVFIDTQLKLLRELFLSVSARGEFFSICNQWRIMPRATLNWYPLKVLKTWVSMGSYSQTPAMTFTALQWSDILPAVSTLKQSIANHAILGLQWSLPKTELRVEGYLKKYNHLPWFSGNGYTATGRGTSKGIDLYIEDHSLLPNLSTRLAYSYCDAHRLWLNDTKECMPSFTSRNNIRLSIKYGIGHFFIGVVDSYASARHYAERRTPPYNSVDLSLTWLANTRTIIYTSWNNVLNRHNIFAYEQGRTIDSDRNSLFYIGVFISLKSNKAYDISNF